MEPLQPEYGLYEREHTAALLKEAVETSKELVRKEIALAKAEVRADLESELAMAKGLGVAGICALLTANMLLVAIAFALSLVIPGWFAALIVAAVVLAAGTVAGLIGWRKRVAKPLSRTQQTLKEDVQWAKERLA